MRKIAVIFPGVGYTKDKPLLYYSGKAAVKCGYELKAVSFNGLDWSKEKLKNRDFLLDAVDKCLLMTEETLRDFGNISGDKVVFISKSIGTVVANAFAKKMGINPTQICFSPLELIEDFVREGNGELFYGDNDPFADYVSIERIAKEKKLEMHRISGGNHSLETGDILTDIDNMKDIMSCVFEIIS